LDASFGLGVPTRDDGFEPETATLLASGVEGNDGRRDDDVMEIGVLQLMGVPAGVEENDGRRDDDVMEIGVLQLTGVPAGVVDRL
jgi:hypothetical protein